MTLKLEGQTFANWTVLGVADERRRGMLLWRCRCVCGTERDLLGSVLRLRKSRSCGCRTRDITIKHGQYGNKLYKVWSNMIQRCTNPNVPDYRNYGARGIRVCRRWRDFSCFAEDMGATWAEGSTIDRINNDDNYAPGNCRWVSRSENLRNRRTNVMLTHDGKTQCMTDWAEEKGLPFNTLKARLKYGWSVEDALERPRAVRRKGE